MTTHERDDRGPRHAFEAGGDEPHLAGTLTEDDEALVFSANSVVVGTTVVMSTAPPRVGRQLEKWGFTVVESPADEFLKAGGGCRCVE